jgi:methyltransferase (TIGR00027 family)
VSQPGPLIHDISDTARWAAVYRARESERPDALFRDPFARRLAGERGEQIAAAIPFSNKQTWAWVTRTCLFDQFITEQIRDGTDTVLNLAAGLDARPYRMALPATLRWVEVDLPDLLAYKEEVLASEKPACAVERVRLDLAHVGGRRQLFERIGRDARKVLIITEGLLMYLLPDEVGALAQDLATPPSFQRWVLNLLSPGLMRVMQKQMGTQLSQAGAPFQFAPAEGPGFFTHFGWKVSEVRSLLKTGAKLKRLTFWMRLLALLPESQGAQGSRPWSGVCMLAKA